MQPKMLFLGIPVDETKLREEFAAAGLPYPPFEDRTGGLELKCEGCNEDVMIGPKQSRVWLEVSGMVLCPTCTVKVMTAAPGGGI